MPQKKGAGQLVVHVAPAVFFFFFTERVQK